ncbi:MAG: type II toxin-antitoxin system prevent-host-death family antitoxin [Pseudohongiella sp.]|uniref:type II toxin-antitoxin system Phd/YefM family antitoxin n=1 Tax=Pseudohongiella sp. TaxID=1979412 RepID=UPI00349FEF07
MKIVPLSEAQRGLKTILDGVVNDADIAIIQRGNAEDAVVMSLGHYNSLMETVHLLRSPANSEHLRKSMAHYQSRKAGQTKPDKQGQLN